MQDIESGHPSSAALKSKGKKSWKRAGTDNLASSEEDDRPLLSSKEDHLL